MDAVKVRALFKKQLKDTWKNKEVLIQFLLFPIIAVIMQNVVKVDGMPENFFVTLFATMYIGMAPLTSMAAIISEEKERNTLRVLMMSNVTPVEYMLGTGTYIFFACMIGGVVFGITGRYEGGQLVRFLLILAVGILTSLMIGAVIGIKSKNQMAATSITVPLMMVFSFLPMLSMFNQTIAKISRFTYSQQIQNMMNELGAVKIVSESTLIIAGNLAIVILLFALLYGNIKE